MKLRNCSNNCALITDRVRSTTVRYCFHGCLSVHKGDGVPQGIYPQPRYLPPGQGTYPLPGNDGGRGGTPRYLPPPKVLIGGRSIPRYLPPARSWGGGTPMYLPPTKVPIPHPRNRTADEVLDTPRSVCLLRSHRTFLSLRIKIK